MIFSKKFSMRDFLWLVAVLGLALGWTRDRIGFLREVESMKVAHEKSKADLVQAQIQILKEQLKVHQEARRLSGGGLRTGGAVRLPE